MRFVAIIVSVVSGVFGIGLAGVALVGHDVVTGFQGLSTVTIAVLVAQVADVRQRLVRLENLAIKEKGK